MKNTRYSYQREVIYNNVMSRKDHPTAEQIYEDVKKEIPSTSILHPCKTLEVQNW